jgi:hypothetical protein
MHLMIVVFTLRTSVPRIKPDEEDVRKQIGDQVQAFSGEAAQALGPEALMKLPRIFPRILPSMHVFFGRHSVAVRCDKAWN